MNISPPPPLNDLPRLLSINDILDRSKKQDEIKEIKLPKKTVISTEELKDVLNEHFINTGPNLAEKIQNENDGTFQDLTNKQDPEFSFSQLVLQWFIILLTICRVQKQPVLVKYQPSCSVLSFLQLH